MGDTDPDGGAVDGGDHGLGAADHGDDVLGTFAWGVAVAAEGGATLRIEAALPGGDIGAGAVSTAGPGEHDRADAAVVAGGVEGGAEVAVHTVGPGVELLRPVERNQGHTAALLVDDLLVVHRGDLL